MRQQDAIYVEGKVKTKMAELCERLTDKCNLFRALGFECSLMLLGHDTTGVAKDERERKKMNKTVIKRNEYLM